SGDFHGIAILESFLAFHRIGTAWIRRSGPYARARVSHSPIRRGRFILESPEDACRDLGDIIVDENGAWPRDRSGSEDSAAGGRFIIGQLGAAFVDVCAFRETDGTGGRAW